MTKPKPRAFRSEFARGDCTILDDGERVVDAGLDIYDGKESAAELLRFAGWLKRATAWAKDKSSDPRPRARRRAAS